MKYQRRVRWTFPNMIWVTVCPDKLTWVVRLHTTHAGTDHQAEHTQNQFSVGKLYLASREFLKVDHVGSS